MKKIFASLALAFVLVPTIVVAQTPNFSATTVAYTNPCSLDAVRGTTTGAATTFPRCVNQIYVWSLGVAVLLALLMVVIGGYYYMTSGGNAEQASKGKEYITGALVGIIILFCAYLLLNTINPDLVNFDLSSLN